MSFIRLFFICTLVFISLSSMNYLLYDKLSLLFVSLNLLFIFMLLGFGNKLCLNFFKAKELTQSEDEELINFLKSISFTTGTSLPDVYVYENSTKSCLILKSLFSWSVLLDKALIQKMSTEQKYVLMKDVFRLQRDNKTILRTFGMTLEVLILSMLKLKVFRWASLKITFVFFATPIFKIIQSITNPYTYVKLDPSLEEFILENREYFKGISTKVYFLKLLEGSNQTLYKFINYDMFTSFRRQA